LRLADGTWRHAISGGVGVVGYAPQSPFLLECLVGWLTEGVEGMVVVRVVRSVVVGWRRMFELRRSD
jgi:hypothetical protein